MMRTLIYGAGPIGQWLALRLHQAGEDVTLLARGKTFKSLDQDGVRMIDGFSGEEISERVKLVDGLNRHDQYDLVVVAMKRSSRLRVCPVLARNPSLKNILFMGNDVSGFPGYLEHLSKDQVLLGFPGVGGGWEDGRLVILDRERRGGPFGEVFLGELDGSVKARTKRIKELFQGAGIKAHVEKNMDGWLKYHFAFMAPTAGVVFANNADMKAVAQDREAIHLYCKACREAGNVLRKIGYRRRQPGIFNLYYWLPRWMEPMVFSKLFGSRSSEIRFGLHAQVVGPELMDLGQEFDELKRRAEMKTPALDSLLACVPDQEHLGQAQ